MYVFASGQCRRCGDERGRGFGLGFTNPVGECGTCFCVWAEVVWESGWVHWSRVRDGGVVLCIVLGGDLGILGAPSVQSCCTLSISAS